MRDFLEKIPSELKDQKEEVIIYRITNYPADFTLQVLLEKFSNDEIIITPFQRGFVWTVSQASKLIESFLLGLPVPSVFFYKQHNTQKLLVIDGQQRLKSIFSYFMNSWPDSDKQFYLKDVNVKWEGKHYSDLEDSDKRRLKDSVLRAVIVDQIDPKDNTSIFHIFERLNTGGTLLKNQEVRNCIYQGEFNDLLKRLNVEEAFRKIIGTPKPDKRMRDVELILRFFALLHEYKKYKKPMKDFLSDFMGRYKVKGPALQQLQATFQETVSAVLQHLGPNPFRIKAGLNVAVFDSVMVAFALNLNRVPQQIKTRYKELMNNDAYVACVSKATTNDRVVRRRISLAVTNLFRS